MAFSFTAPQTAGAATGNAGSSFSGLNSSTSSNTGGFSFGASTAPPTGSLFGSTPAASTGFSFTTATPTAASTPTPASFSFNSAPATSTAPTSTSNFSFGATTNQPAAASGSAFSISTPAPATTLPTTGFSFGSGASTTAASGSAFSLSVPASTTPSSTNFSFGSSASQPSSNGSSFSLSNPAAPTSSSNQPSFGFGQNTFGATSNSAPSFGSLGSNPAPTSSTNPSSFCFGQNTFNSTSNSAPSFGSLGSNPAAPTSSTNPSSFSFGQNTFGSTSNSASSFGSLGTTQAGAFGSAGLGGTSTFAPSNSQFGNSVFGSNQASTNPSLGQSSPLLKSGFAAPVDSALDSLNAFKMAYKDPQHSRFKHMFYNVVDPSLRNLYNRPPNISERLWKQAEADNPDPDNCVPAAVVGFDQLEARVKTQQEYAITLGKYVEELRKSLKVVLKASRSADIKMEKCRHEHMLLSHKMIDVMRKIEVYQCLHIPLHSEEIHLREELNKVQATLNQPTAFKAWLDELVSLERSQEEEPVGNLEQLSEEDVNAVYDILKNQSIGLHHLTTILKKDMRDLEIIEKGLVTKRISK